MRDKDSGGCALSTDRALLFISDYIVTVIELRNVHRGNIRVRKLRAFHLPEVFSPLRLYVFLISLSLRSLGLSPWAPLPVCSAADSR